MKKILLFIFTFGITISLYGLLNKPIEAKAITFSDLVNDSSFAGVAWFQNYSGSPLPGDYIGVCWYDRAGAYFSDSNVFTTTNHYGFELYSFTDLQGSAFDLNTGYSYLTIGYPFVTVRGLITSFSESSGPYYGSIEDYLANNVYPPPPEPSWWNNVADEFERQLGIDQEVVDPISEFLYNFWSWLFPQDEEEAPDLVITETPTLTPLPTQIPYETFIDPNSGQLIYRYDISGTPTESPLPPPVQPVIITPNPGYGIVTPSKIVYPDEGLQDVIDNIDDNLEEYKQGLDTIGNSFSVLPVKWFVFFGIPAAIILIAGVIKSLLG